MGLVVLLLICRSPAPHGIQDRLETVAQFSQRILHAGRHLCIDLPGEQTACLHLAELGGQHLLRHMADGFFSPVQRPRHIFGKSRRASKAVVFLKEEKRRKCVLVLKKSEQAI